MTLQKTELFMPLTAEVIADENREFRVTVIPKGQPGPAFQTLGQMASVAAETGLAHGRKNCEPRLSVQREGERIASIRIHCSCGQIMEVACVYDEPAPAK
jgi:hypothetical protein